MFGSTTALGHYCPIGMVITNKEDEKAQDFLFEFIKENANVLPSFCMADAAKATSKSLEKNLPETIRLMCWWHKHKNTKTQLAFVRSADPGIYSSIVSDLKDEFYDLELLCFLIVDCASDSYQFLKFWCLTIYSQLQIIFNRIC